MTEPFPAYLLLGPEEGQKQEFIESLAAKIRSKTGAPPETYKFYAFETNPGDIVSLLRNGSLFTPHKLVRLAGIEELKRKEDLAQIIEYCTKPSPDSTLVMTGEAIQADAKLEKAVGAAGKKIFWELFDNQKSGWITGYFAKNGITIRRDAVELLLEMVENDTQELRKECEKLVLFFPRGAAITPDEIERFIYHSKEENVFTLFEEIVSRNLTLSLEILQKIQLSKDSNPVQILSGLLWQWRRLLALSTLTKRSYGLPEAFTKLGMKSKRHQKIYGEGVRNYSRIDLERIITLTARYDGLIRSTRAELHQHLLSMYLYYAVSGKGVTPEPVVF